MEIFGVAAAIYARYARYDDDVATPREKCRYGLKTQTLNLVVYREVLLDVRICRGEVCLRLIVVVIRYEVLHGVVREESFELVI